MTWRFLAGAGSAILLMGAGFLWGQGQSRQQDMAGSSPSAPTREAPSLLAAPIQSPAAPAASREQKRFSRYDKDKNGAITRAEYLVSRQKAFAKLDTNHDGRLSMEEYAVKAIIKFDAADRNRSGSLDAPEFAATAAKRKARPAPDCPPVKTEDDSSG